MALVIKKRIRKALKCFLYFKNPITVIKFLWGRFAKGKKIKIQPKNEKSFFVARAGDFWMIEKIINGGTINTYYDKEGGEGYILEDGIFFRQGTSDTTVYKEIFIDNCYEKSLANIKENSVVIDIGAHIGIFSMYCSPKCKQVFSYEAHPENFSLAQKNIKNKNINNIKIENLAVWSKSNEKIFISDSEETRTGEHTINKEKGFEVETISLEDIFLKNNIQRCDLLKIDVEGAEYAILFSAPDIIFEKIESISMEYHPDVNKDKRKDDLVRLFENKGYQTEETILKEGCGLIYAKKKS